MRTLLLLTLVLGLLLGVVGTAQAFVFFDNFSDGNANGWELLPGARGLPAEWSVQDGTLTQTGTDDYIMALVTSPALASQTVEVQVSTLGYAGVVLWQQDSTNFVSVNINPASTGVYIVEYFDGQGNEVRYDFHTGYLTEYDLRVNADSGTGQVAIYLNDAYLFTYAAHTSHRTGLSGVFAGNQVGYFDDFLLIAAPACPVPEPSTMLLFASGLAGLGGMAWQRHRRG
jgi:hypothetical protein